MTIMKQVLTILLLVIATVDAVSYTPASTSKQSENKPNMAASAVYSDTTNIQNTPTIE